MAGLPAARPSVIRSFVRRYRSEILAEWKRVARDLQVAKQMTSVALVDHIPELLDEIADIAEDIGAGNVAETAFDTARRHAVDRLADGFDVTTVVRELSLLRGAVLTVWEAAKLDRNLAELRALDLAIDRAIAASVGRYTEAHERTLAGIDRISTASFESRDVQELLQRLLAVFQETTPAVDMAAIFLVEGDRLYLRAAVGLDADLASGISVAFGEGFAGTIAARREPLALHAAYIDPLIQSEEIRAKRVRALYGVPLIQDNRVIGVAHMGSCTANEFSHEDRQFFSSLAARATFGIVLATVNAARERTFAKLESLLAASPIGIAFVDRDFRYLRINDALAALNGQPADAHIGRTVHDMLPEVADTLVPMLRDVIETGRPRINLELEHQGRHLLANYFPVRMPSGEIHGVGAFVTDMTDFKHAQEALRVEQVRVQAILEHAPAAIWIKDHEGRIILANERLAHAVGETVESVIGKRSTDVQPPGLADEHERHDRQVLDEQRTIEFEESTPERTFLTVKFPIPGDPPLVGAIATEITQRKRMEEELRNAVRTREEVLAVVSHDLRNPLGAVQLGTTLLLERLGHEPRAHRHLDMIHRACTRMENLIDDLLDTANIRTGRLRLELARQPADAVVAEALDLQQPLAEEAGITLERDCHLDGLEIMCDRDRILQVFANLIGNAIKFCRAGDTITVTCKRTGDSVYFAVRDTGPGIQPDVLPRLFDAYWSGLKATARASGLGLYISRGIIDGHGGEIGVESMPGEGATFYFTLPVAPA